MLDSEAIIAILYTVTAVFALLMGIPQTVKFVRLGIRRFRFGYDDGNQWMRLFTVLVTMGLLGGVSTWRALLWIDFAFFGQQLLGAQGQRLPAEMVLATLFACTSVYAYGLYRRLTRSA
jgi:hypothetical protein